MNSVFSRHITLIELHDDVLMYICEFCDIQTLGRLAQTCRKLYSFFNEHDSVWEEKSRCALGTNLTASPMKKRSRPLLYGKSRCAVSKRWLSGDCRRQVLWTYPRCMPWIYLENTHLYCSYGRILVRFIRNDMGCIVKSNLQKLVPFNCDISKFIINENEIIICGINGEIGRWNKFTFQKLTTNSNAHAGDICALDAKEDIIISGSKDCHIKVWKKDSNNTLLKQKVDVDVKVISLAILPTNRFFVAGFPGTNDKHPLQLFDLERGQVVSSFGPSYRKGAGILDIFPEFEHTFLCCGYDTTIQLWDKRDPLTCAAKWIEPYDNSIYTVKSDHNISIVSGANRNGIVHVWDKRQSNCQFIHHVREYNSPTYCTAFDASHIFAVFDKGAVQFCYL